MKGRIDRSAAPGERRRFSTWSVCFSLLLISAAAAGSAAPAPRPPNILFILADDLGWRDLGAYGSRFYRTPHIDALMKRGIRFTQGYSAHPLCSPTRAALMTGQYPARLRFSTPSGHVPQVILEPRLPERARSDQRVITPQSRTRLPLEIVTLAEVLQGAGYRTAHFGKWHLGRPPYMPEQQGFDLNIGGGPYPGPPSYFSPYRNDHLSDGPEGEHITDRLTAEAISFLRENRKRPFFLNFWHYSVHAPFQAEEKLVEEYGKRVDPCDPQQNPVMGAMIEALDRSTGRLMQALRELGLEKDTLVVFASDNGGNMYNRIGPGIPPTSNAPLRGGKATIYEGGVRTPLAAIWPGKIRPGVDRRSIVSSIDWFPTLIAAAGAARPKGHRIDGANLMPLLTAGKPLDRDSYYCHFPHYTPATGNLPATAVRRGDWKLIRFYDAGPEDRGRYELYHLGKDPGEKSNLAEREPERVREMDALISRHLTDTRALVPAPNPNYAPGTGGWYAGPATALTLRAGELVVKATAGAPSIETSQVNAATGPYVLELQIAAPSGGSARIYWHPRAQGPFHPDRSAALSLEASPQSKHYEIKIPATAALARLRFDPDSGPGEWRIAWMRLRDSAGEVAGEWRFDRIAHPGREPE